MQFTQNREITIGVNPAGLDTRHYQFQSFQPFSPIFQILFTRLCLLMTPMFLEKDESEKLLSIPAGLAFHNFCNLCKYYHFIVSPSAFENFCLHERSQTNAMSKHFFQLCHILIFCIFDIEQESTVHGVRYFIDGENALHKFAWVVIMVCSVRLSSQCKNFIEKNLKEIVPCISVKNFLD